MLSAARTCRLRCHSLLVNDDSCANVLASSACLPYKPCPRVLGKRTSLTRQERRGGRVEEGGGAGGPPGSVRFRPLTSTACGTFRSLVLFSIGGCMAPPLAPPPPPDDDEEAAAGAAALDDRTRTDPLEEAEELEACCADGPGSTLGWPAAATSINPPPLLATTTLLLAPPLYNRFFAVSTSRAG